MPPTHEDPEILSFMQAAPAVQVEWLLARGLPPAVLLVVQNACGQRCWFCQGQGTSEMSAAAASRVESLFAHLDARPAGVTRLLIGGNEPTLHPAFEAVLRRARAVGFTEIALMTNGATLGEGAARWAALGVDEVVAPLYGVDAAAHDAVAGVPCFDDVLAGLEAAHEAGMTVRVHTLLLRSVLPALPALSALVRARYGTRLAAGLLRAKPGVDWARTAPPLGEVRAALAAMGADGPDLLMAPECLAWGEGDGVCPTDAPAGPLGAPALLARIYFSHQARGFAPACAGCARRATCPGVVQAYLAG